VSDPSIPDTSEIDPAAVVLPEQHFEVLVRVTVRDMTTGAVVGKPQVSAFAVDRRPEPARLAEAATKAAQAVADGRGLGTPLGARMGALMRDAARHPLVSRGTAVLTAAMRRGADALEHERAVAAARLVTQAPPEGTE
jgi:hypothetical protein